jgi:hypothetical protein
MSTVGIVSVIYQEPEWINTQICIEQCGVPIEYVDRRGVGSLAKALNDGFKKINKKHRLDYVWFVTNPCFDSTVLPKLIVAMDETGYDAIHPSFDSDHKHLQPDGSGEIRPVTFVEFTCPIVRVETFQRLPLDELMPYWGHDIDWGYRVRRDGGTVAVHHGTYVKHEYIRNRVKTRPHRATLVRRAKRKRTNSQTYRRLEQLYGKTTWRDIVGYYGK